MKRICCIYSRNKLDFKKYAKSSSYDEVINYNDITSKLIKNDINSVKPSTIIVNSYIRKKLQKALESKSTNNVLYALKTLDEGTVSSIRELISEFYKPKYELNLIVLNENKIKIEITDSFKKNFDDIEYINIWCKYNKKNWLLEETIKQNLPEQYNYFNRYIKHYMITHRLFPKGEQMHVLLSSNVNPNILIPVKGIVKDIKFDDVNPQYLIKIIHFYDTMKYLQRYFFNMRFSNAIGKKPRPLKLNPEDFKDSSELLKRMNEADEKNFYIVVDSIMCTKFMADMTGLFNKIQDHLIEIKLREIREMSIRAFYKGRYRVDSIGNFNIRLRRFIGDKVEEADIPWDKYIKML